MKIRLITVAACAVLVGFAVSASAETKSPRIPFPKPEELSPKVRAMVEHTPLNVSRMMARASEPVFNGFGQFTGSFYMGSKLDPVLREVAILRVGYLSNAPYETWQHEASAKLLGMTEAQFAAIKKGGKNPGTLNEAQQAVLDFTDDVVKNVRASDATLSGVRRHLSDTDTVDLILVIGAYMTVSRLLETTGVPMENKPIDWAAMNKAMKDAKKP